MRIVIEFNVLYISIISTILIILLLLVRGFFGLLFCNDSRTLEFGFRTLDRPFGDTFFDDRVCRIPVPPEAVYPRITNFLYS